MEQYEHAPRTGGLNTKRGSLPGSTRFTLREQAVARLVARGMANQHAAVELFVSVGASQYHPVHVCATLGMRSRAELAASHRDELGEEKVSP